MFVATAGSRLVFTPGEKGYGFHLEVADGELWRPVTAAGNTLVAGESFDLRPTQVTGGPHALAISGSRTGVEASYTWQGTVAPVPGTDWFHLRIVLDSGGFAIGPHRSVEPQISVNLGPLPPYERGDHVWFKTLVQNPTQWNGEGRGNDFPALSYYDPYLKAQFRMFFDMTSMSWMGKDTIARFYGYSCGLRRLYDNGAPSAEIGLLAHAQSGHRFPAGPQVLSWYLAAEHLDGEPTPASEQDALTDLVASAVPLLRSSTGHWPARATSWADFAAGCATDLMSTEHSWGSDQSGEYLLSYVDGRSDAWETTMAARGLQQDGDEPCLESALWALRPIDVLACAFPDRPYGALAGRLDSFIRAEVGRDRCQVLSGLAQSPTPMGSWQYVYILAELWFLYSERDDELLLARIRQEIDTVAVPLARGTQYLFPLQFDKASLRKIGPGSAYAVAGPYALLMVDLAARTGEPHYLDEARAAIRTLVNVPIDAALQEVVLIAQAIDAADRLHQLTGEPEWDQARSYLRAQTLRMMYWYDDKTSARVEQVCHLGMFLACANINYPAFFENIEADARLAAAIGSEQDPTATLKILDYGRRNNFSFFPRCSPDMYGPMPLDFIPFEDVPMLEGPNDAGFMGQEIYGAGFTFRAHLLWDAYAFAADREVMVLSVDSYREHLDPAAPWQGSFLLFNSTDLPVQTAIELPIIGGGDQGKVTVGPPDEAACTHVVPAGASVAVSLPPGGWAAMSVAVVRAGA
jgi:hypothetical protein